MKKYGGRWTDVDFGWQHEYDIRIAYIGMFTRTVQKMKPQTMTYWQVRATKDRLIDEILLFKEFLHTNPEAMDHFLQARLTSTTMPSLNEDLYLG